DPCTISSIAGDLDIDPATVVRTVDSLEKRGLVKRRRSREDRRQVFVEFTDAGCAADRKSTRLNSSHSQISYAVFCLKKKNKGEKHRRRWHEAGSEVDVDDGRSARGRGATCAGELDVDEHGRRRTREVAGRHREAERE